MNYREMVIRLARECRFMYFQVTPLPVPPRPSISLTGSRWYVTLPGVARDPVPECSQDEQEPWSSQ